MEKLGLNEIRERYLSFFESKGHLRMPSFPLVPQNDNSLLLINAGMAPLKPYFTGKELPPSKRVTTCQKCIRTPDIERVGKTARHGTFFEMLGNFSFGDYFKEEAIAWAWEFVTKHMNMPVDRLWVSVYEEDDEAEKIWIEKVGVAPERIVRLGKEDNFWEIGTGPCGPCSEIYFDRGAENGCGSDDCAVGCDCDRFVEFWNLVFTQFDKDDQGNYNRLAKPNIDTGMGMERLAAIMQDVGNLFEVDTVRSIMQRVCKEAGTTYGGGGRGDVSLRIITDHIRGATFMISDGITPDNEGRGYVLRRLIRRAARHGKLIGIDGAFLHNIVGTVVAENGGAYPELADKEDYIKKVVLNEEESFSKTIDQGLSILNDYIEVIQQAGGRVLSGEQAFKLYDTYGFPIDLTLEILEERGLEADTEGFNALMQEQRERARAARGKKDGAGWDDGVYERLGNEPTEFAGYDEYECNGNIIAIIRGDELVEYADEGDEVTVILDKTVFYGESGGQAGDRGTLTGGCKADVTDTQKLPNGKILHKTVVTNGRMERGGNILAQVDIQRRRSISRNHSATHLLQRALRDVLGNHVSQSGSSVTDEYLRFDFAHFAPLTPEELIQVEDAVNERILQSLEVDIKSMPADEARKSGAVALFGEKYGATVRVVDMGGYSIELCGGCHVRNTSQIGLFKIVHEGGTASGIRRIEAITGMMTLRLMRARESMIREVTSILRTNPNDVMIKIETFLGELKTANRELEQLRGKLASGRLDELVNAAEAVGPIAVITGRMDELGIDGLREMGDKLRDKVKNAVILLASAKDDKVSFVAMASKDAIAAGINAGGIVREVAKITGGGGGGKPDSAQAGGKDVGKVPAAIAKVAEIVRNQLK